MRSLDHVALGVIPKSRPSSGYWNPALSDLDDIVSRPTLIYTKYLDLCLYVLTHILHLATVIFFGESVAQDQPAHTCSLILLYTFRYCITVIIMLKKPNPMPLKQFKSVRKIIISLVRRERVNIVNCLKAKQMIISEFMCLFLEILWVRKNVI